MKSFIRRRSHLYTSLVLIALIAVVGLFAPTPSAEASAAGCTFAPWGDMCFGVNGSSTWINTARIDRGKVSWEGICDYGAKVEVRQYYGSRPHEYGVVWADEIWRRGECAIGNAWFDFDIYRSFPHNSKICGIWHENGEPTATVCHNIYR